MNKKILFALLSTTILSHNLLGLDYTCTTTTEERAALETRASIVTAEQQRFSQPPTSPQLTLFSQPDLFSFPFFEPLSDKKETTEKEWLQEFKNKQDNLKDKVKSGLSHKISGQYDLAKVDLLFAAQNGSTLAMGFLSDIYKEQGNFIESFYWLFLAIEINWITTGEIHEKLKGKYIEILPIIKEQKNKEDLILINILDQIKDTNQLSIYERLDYLIGSQNITDIVFLIFQQISGFKRFCQFEAILKHKEYFRSYMQIFRITHLTEGLNLTKSVSEKFSEDQECYTFCILIDSNLIDYDENGQTIPEGKKDSVLGRIYRKIITSQTKDTIESKGMACAELASLIYKKKYSYDENGEKISEINRIKHVFDLYKKSINIGNKEAIFSILDLINNNENSDDGEILTHQERDEMLRDIFYADLEKGNHTFLPLLAKSIMNGEIYFDKNNQIIPENERRNIAQNYYKIMFEMYGVAENTGKNKNIDHKIYSDGLLDIASFIINGEININDYNESVTDMNRSESVARILGKAMQFDTISGSIARYFFYQLLYHGKIIHNRHGKMMPSIEERENEGLLLLKEYLQKYNDIAPACDLALCVLNKKTNSDEYNQIILPENRLDWVENKIKNLDMDAYPFSYIVLSFCLLEKNNDLKTQEKVYNLMKKAFFCGETSHIEYMITLKEMIDSAKKRQKHKKKAARKAIKSTIIDRKTELEKTPSLSIRAKSQKHDSAFDETSKKLDTAGDSSDSNSDNEKIYTTREQSLPTLPDTETPEERAQRKSQAKAIRYENQKKIKKEIESRDFSRTLNKMTKHIQNSVDRIVKWGNDARECFNDLLPAQQRNVTDIINHIKNSKNPYDGAEKLQGDLEGWFSHRVSGKHRFIFKLSPDKKQIIIRSCYTHYKK